ncbi:co-chaperonin GroES [Vibrio splendidus 12B01]|nr:co-chaperonin GroES [Vibrio splendidus 12B01]
MRAGREEKQMRDVKEQIRVNEIRDAKYEKQKQRRRFSCLPLFVTRLPASRICL